MNYNIKDKFFLQLLKQFLVENNLYDKLIINYLEYTKSKSSKFDLLNHIMKTKLRKDVFYGFFRWDETIEGFTFWRQASDNWRTYYNNKIGEICLRKKL